MYRYYEVRDKVLVNVYNPAGLKQRAAGPCPIKKIHVKGTLTRQRSMPNMYEHEIGVVLPEIS
jgi:hypothetical protein